MAQDSPKREPRFSTPLTILALFSRYARVPHQPPKPLYLADFAQRVGLKLDLRCGLALSEFEPAVKSARADAVLLLFTWDQPIADVVELTARLRLARPRLPLILVDQSDCTASPFMQLLPYFDLMLKSQTLRDRSKYATHFSSGYVFTEFLRDKLGYDLHGWQFGSAAQADMLGRIATGWNLGATQRIHRLLTAGTFSLPWSLRLYDFHCRLTSSFSADDWYTRYRRWAAAQFTQASAPYRCTGLTRVSPRRYLIELACSRFAFSPFGWGEICHRDFEAAALGCVLIKPSMEHVETNPGIYVAHETYLPVKWDLSDLADVCRWCMEHAAECSRIASNARATLRRFFRQTDLMDVAPLDALLANLQATEPRSR